jgi:starch synthase
MGKRILYITQEITPYLPESRMSKIGRYLPQAVQEKGREIRTFMPRYGCINERRHQLHEVIRLSGMNLIINDNDYPLIIKVASIQAARMQVYFIDNEDYFKRKAVLKDEEGNFFPDNDERAIFFCRGVLETVKKLGWAPDVIHCHGWMSSLIPFYIKTSYKNDPIFDNAKVVYSLYNNKFTGSLSKDFAKKAKMDNHTDEELAPYKSSDFVSISKAAMDYADAVIVGSQKVDKDIKDHFEALDKPKLGYIEDETYIDDYNEFYSEVLEEEVLVD